MKSLLDIRDLGICYGRHPAVQNLSLRVGGGRMVMLVGESGSGKSTLLRSMLGLLGPGGFVKQGEILFSGRPLPLASQKAMRGIRGKDIGIILQNPDQYLDPMMTVAAQYHEALAAHAPISRAESHKKAAAALDELGFSSPEAILRMRPYELSGGMCQRVAIVIAVANRPRLLLADEPTSALDVSSQREVMALLKRVQAEYGVSVLLVTHNMSLVSRYADEVGVMHKGRLLEWGPREEVLRDAKHPHTRMLLDSVPALNGCPPPPCAEGFTEGMAGTNTCFVGGDHWWLQPKEEAS